MNIRSTVGFFALPVLFLLIFAGGGCDRANTIGSPIEINESSTVLDYYLALPPEYLEANFSLDELLDSKGDRSDEIEEVDIENHYLKLKDHYGPGPGSDHGEMALFIKPDGTRVLAMSIGHCSESCYLPIELVVFEGGKWKYVTQELLPPFDIDEIRFAEYAKIDPAMVDSPIYIDVDIPRYGTDIVIYDQNISGNIGVLNWDDGKFVFGEES